MNATFENGKVIFTTNHFSTYAVIFEDEVLSTPQKSGLSGGAIAGIVIASVVAFAGIYVLCFFVLKKKGWFAKRPDDAPQESEEDSEETSAETTIEEVDKTEDTDSDK